MNLQYRADIDGLRAIAVLAVLFFHTEVPGFSGGFVGVDIFFVISGFLITSIILKEINAGKFSIANFYDRRIRRIFPALFPVILFSLAVGAYLFDDKAFKDFGESITATTLFSSNILFWRESGYFAAPSLQKPLLHTWSLAVEEQFYIFFPFALLAIYRFLKKQYFAWVVVAFVLSFGASVYGVYNHPGATFYLVLTRAWELMAGSILALGVVPSPSTPAIKNTLSLAGISLIMYSIFFYTEATLFPGHNALAPVIGSGLIIHSVRGGGGTSLVAKLLSARPMVFIGLISYSLYLWHWPLIAFSKYLMFREFTWIDSALIILASFAIAIASWKFIEQPFRGKNPVLPSRKQLFAYASVTMIIAAGIGGMIHVQEGMGWRYPEATAKMRAVLDDPEWKKHGELQKINKKISDGVTPPLIGNQNTEPTFALIGDSHARALIPAIESHANKNNVSGYVITSNAVPLLQGVQRKDKNYDIAKHNENILEFLTLHPEVKTIMIAGRWMYYINGTYKQEKPLHFKLEDAWEELQSNSPNELILKKGLKRSINTLLQEDKKVFLISSVPEIGYDVPRIYWMSLRYPWLIDIEHTRPTLEEYHNRQKEATTLLKEIETLVGVRLVNPEFRLFDEKGRALIIANGESLYVDDDHLSTAGAHYVAPVFDEVFAAIAKDSRIARNDYTVASE